MKTIGITGGSGFVGGNLAAYLEKQGLKLRLISRSELLTIDERVLEKCDALVHLAGKAHDIKKTADPAAYYEVNFELTKRIYDAFLASAAKKFIFLSSVKASADSQQGVLTEEHAANPKTDYGKSKLMA